MKQKLGIFQTKFNCLKTEQDDNEGNYLVNNRTFNSKFQFIFLNRPNFSGSIVLTDDTMKQKFPSKDGPANKKIKPDIIVNAKGSICFNDTSKDLATNKNTPIQSLYDSAEPRSTTCRSSIAILHSLCVFLYRKT